MYECFDSRINIIKDVINNTYKQKTSFNNTFVARNEIIYNIATAVFFIIVCL